MIRLVVEPAIWERFAGLRIVLVWAGGLDNRRERPELASALERAIERAREGWSQPNAQSHPYIAAWREAVKITGFSGKKFPSSIEALARRVLSGKGIGTINPLVDFYNRVSLTHVVPAGGWDLEALEDGPAGRVDLRLTLTQGGERFQAIGAPAPLGVEAGEAAYLVGDQVVTRHFVWRQSELGKLTGETNRALLVSECLGAVDDETAGAVARDLADGLAEHFGAEPRSAVLTAGAEPLELD